MPAHVRVVLPAHLRTLAGAGGEIDIVVPGAVTPRAIVEALESRYPMLGGTICDYGTRKRRPLVRFFACEEDLSHADMDAALPEAVASGREPFLIIGAMAGG